MPCSRPRKYCGYNGCTNNNSMGGRSFFRFPKDRNRCQLWVKASKNPKFQGLPLEKLYHCAVLCGDHFQDWCFMNVTQRTRLVHNAIPDSAKPKPASPTPCIEYILPDKSCKNTQDSPATPPQTMSVLERLLKNSPPQRSSVSEGMNLTTVPIQSPAAPTLPSLPFRTSSESTITIVSVSGSVTVNGTESHTVSQESLASAENYKAPSSNSVASTPLSLCESCGKKYVPREIALMNELKALRKSNMRLRKKLKVLEERLKTSE